MSYKNVDLQEVSSRVLEHMRKMPGCYVKRKSEEWRGGSYLKNEVDVMDGDN